MKKIDLTPPSEPPVEQLRKIGGKPMMIEDELRDFKVDVIFAKPKRSIRAESIHGESYDEIKEKT